MSEFTKREKRRLRELAAEAHEREMGVALRELEERFRDWQQGVIGPHDLNQKIHEFHNGISRDLYKMYSLGDPFFAVAKAIHDGTLKRSNIEPGLLKKFESILKFFPREDDED